MIDFKGLNEKFGERFRVGWGEIPGSWGRDSGLDGERFRVLSTGWGECASLLPLSNVRLSGRDSGFIFANRRALWRWSITR